MGSVLTLPRLNSFTMYYPDLISVPVFPSTLGSFFRGLRDSLMGLSVLCRLTEKRNSCDDPRAVNLSALERRGCRRSWSIEKVAAAVKNTEYASTEHSG